MIFKCMAAEILKDEKENEIGQRCVLTCDTSGSAEIFNYSPKDAIQLGSSYEIEWKKVE